jgi:hypothetical protein
VLLFTGCSGAGDEGRVTAPFASAIPAATSRVWVGPDTYANRLLDWRIEDGRIECIEGRPAKPMRTLHLLTRALGEQSGTLSMSVRTGPLGPDGPAGENTWTGFLIGAGGEHVDFRTSALVHHWPAPDGGLIVAVDGTGMIIVRDNSGLEGPKQAAEDIPLWAWPLIEPESVELAPITTGPSPSRDLVLRLEAQPEAGSSSSSTAAARGVAETGAGTAPAGEVGTAQTYRLTVSAIDTATGAPISSASYEGIAAEHLSGNLALVSHQSPALEGPGYWFRDWRVDGSKVFADEDRAFGPVMGTMHTLSRGLLTMTAQMGPLGPQDSQTAELQIRRHGPGQDSEDWQTVATGTLADLSYTITFRVEDWDSSVDTPYRVVYDLRTGDGAGGTTTEQRTYEGTIRRPPVDDNEFVLAAFTGHHISTAGSGHWNNDSFWYPHNELVAAVRYRDPDFLFFSGDQIYEGGLAGIVREPLREAALDYLYHWYRWVWAFRDLTRDIPSVAIPDDHDVYHGNVWGAGGIKAEGPLEPIADNGGYIMGPAWVNAVHRTQTSDLPPPYDPEPIEQGITVYHTDVEYAGVSFAVIADRMWKSPPAVMVPRGRVVNGWFQNPDFDPATEADVPGAVLLGERQLEFLDHWASDWEGGTWMKVLLSQTLFTNLATIPAEAPSGAVIPSLSYAEPGEFIEGDKKAADADSNGWPQSGRNRALRAIRRGLAFHVAGDQHLGSTVQYGIDDWNDAGYAMCVPSVANLWPRRWFPPEEGANRKPGAPRYTGEFLDGFGNKMTVYAVSNPVRSGVQPEALYDRAPGYGIARFFKDSRDIVVEIWPRWVDPSRPDAEQYYGWPVRLNQLDNDGRTAIAHLPTIVVTGMTEPVVQVVAEESGEILYTLRIMGNRFRPKVFDSTGTYTIAVGEPGTDRHQTFTGVNPTDDPGATLDVLF